MTQQLPIFEIFPLRGAGPILLGTSRPSVRAALATAGFPLESSHGATDYFCNSSIQTACDSEGNICFIGISHSERYTALYRGVDVFSLEAADLFSLISAEDCSGPHKFNTYEHLFPNQIITLWDADEQYDHRRKETRLSWAQIGIGNLAYANGINEK